MGEDFRVPRSGKAVALRAMEQSTKMRAKVDIGWRISERGATQRRVH
jgi:hypothetical protein